MARKAREKKQVEFIQPSVEELIGNFEAWEALTERQKTLKDEVKMVTSDLSARIKEYAESVGCTPKEMRSAYKYYLSKINGEVGDSDCQFTLMALVDADLDNK